MSLANADDLMGCICMFKCWCTLLIVGIISASAWVNIEALKAHDFTVRDATLLNMTFERQCKRCCDADTYVAPLQEQGANDDEGDENEWKLVYHLKVDISDPALEEYASVKKNLEDYSCSDTDPIYTLDPCRRCVLQRLALSAGPGRRSRC